MGNILWSVDKRIYSDKENHTLTITGWALNVTESVSVVNVVPVAGDAETLLLIGLSVGL